MNNAQTHLKMGYVWTICLVAACGGLLFGYDWVVIGGAKPFYEAWFSITDPAQSGWAMSSALLGCIFGALISGHCCKVSDEAAFCLIQRPYISKTLLTRRISPRGSP